MGIQIWFHICKWRIFLFKNHLLSGLTRINPETIWIWSKWAKECLNVTSAWEPTCISQKGIKNVFYIFKPIISPFLNHLHSRLTRIKPETIWIWSKWAKECLNVTSAWEPTCISQKGIKNVFYIFKPIIPLFLNSLQSGLVKLGARMTRSR